jgi:hypothetical protein
MKEIDVNDFPHLSVKRAVAPVLIVGALFFIANAIFTIPRIIENFQESDIDAAISLIVSMVGIIVMFGGFALMRAHAVNKKRLEVELDYDEQPDKYENLTS